MGHIHCFLISGSCYWLSFLQWRISTEICIFMFSLSCSTIVLLSPFFFLLYIFLTAEIVFQAGKKGSNWWKFHPRERSAYLHNKYHDIKSQQTPWQNYSCDKWCQDRGRLRPRFWKLCLLFFLFFFIWLLMAFHEIHTIRKHPAKNTKAAYQVKLLLFPS